MGHAWPMHIIHWLIHWLIFSFRLVKKMKTNRGFWKVSNRIKTVSYLKRRVGIPLFKIKVCFKVIYDVI